MSGRGPFGSWTGIIAGLAVVFFFIATIGGSAVAEELVVIGVSVLLVAGVVRGRRRPWRATVAAALRGAADKEVRVGVYRSVRGIVELTGRVLAVDEGRVWLVVTRPTPALSAQHLVRAAADVGLPLRIVAWVDVDGVVTSL